MCCRLVNGFNLFWILLGEKGIELMGKFSVFFLNWMS